MLAAEDPKKRPEVRGWPAQSYGVGEEMTLEHGSVRIEKVEMNDSATIKK